MKEIKIVEGRAVSVAGDDMDTDRIIPARFLKEITFKRMGDYPFFDERFDPQGNEKDHPFNKPEHQGAAVLIGNSNFGCGSSREHAPQALVRWGIRAIVAESYAEIFAGNCVMMGTPAVTASPEDIAELQSIADKSPDSVFRLDLMSMKLNVNGKDFSVSISETRRKALTEGTWDSTAILLANADKVKAAASVLSYMNL